MAKITSFRGAFSFLSNFHPALVTLDGVQYPSVEHAYQAAKTLIHTERGVFTSGISAAAAKRMGRRVTMRPDWDAVKLAVMKELVWQKFSQHPLLAKMLLATKDQILIEGNTWGDRFWGACLDSGGIYRGDNHLGTILMDTRSKLGGKA